MNIAEENEAVVTYGWIYHFTGCVESGCLTDWDGLLGLLDRAIGQYGDRPDHPHTVFYRAARQYVLDERHRQEERGRRARSRPLDAGDPPVPEQDRGGG